MQIDPGNREFIVGIKAVEDNRQSLFLTGKAGTGKTTFLKYFREKTRKEYAILAPTGIAAINAGGVTIHSFFHIAPSIFVPGDPRLRLKASPDDKDRRTIYSEFKYNKEKKELLANLEIIIIDEISMVRCDLLDVIDALLRAFGGGDPNLPFGGKQMLFIGDGFQLPPVVTGEDHDILGRFYESPFFFSAKAFKAKYPSFLELKKIYRQAGDQVFIDLLNRIRVGETREEDIKVLDRKYFPDFDFNANNYVYLGTHKAQVDTTNQARLKALPSKLRIFKGQITGKFPEKDRPAKYELHLKEGAQVMFVKNESSGRYYNGLIAQIKSIDDSRIIVVKKNVEEIVVEQVTWEKIRYRWDKIEKKVKEEIEGTFTQYPLKLAWAITVHKSQGLTFEEVYADVRDAFAEGQVYVALSRCTSLRGLKLNRQIPLKAIKVSQAVIDFYRLMQGYHLPIPADPQIVKFELDKTMVSNGESVTVTWDVKGNEKVELLPFGIVEGAAYQFRPVKEITLQLVVTNSLGIQVRSQLLLIEVDKTPPNISYFKTDFNYVFEDAPFTINWQVENAHKIVITPQAANVQYGPRGKEVRQIEEDTAFTLVATSYYGVEAQEQLTVCVLPLPIIEKILIPIPTVTNDLKVQLKTPQIANIAINTEGLKGALQVPTITRIGLNSELLSRPKFYVDRPSPLISRGVFSGLLGSFKKHIDRLIAEVVSQKRKPYE